MVFESFGKSYGSSRLFEAVNLSLREKKISFVMAPNGTGKTTLIKCILGLEDYEGHITAGEEIEEPDYRERETVAAPPEHRERETVAKPRANREYSEVLRGRILAIWDDCPFYQNLSGWKNLRLMAGESWNRDFAVEAAISYLPEETLNRKVKSYSYGQKKKLALALARIRDPEVLIMDEISNGLDYETMTELKKKLRRWSEQKTVLLTGHQFGFYNGLVDDVYRIRDRKLELVREDFRNTADTLEEVYEKSIGLEESREVSPG